MRYDDLDKWEAQEQDFRNGRLHNQTPPEMTNAESYYSLKQMHSKTSMVIKLESGEKVFGVIKWYDKNCINVLQRDGTKTVIAKRKIKYIYKQDGSEN